jgi:hypothetical protein
MRICSGTENLHSFFHIFVSLHMNPIFNVLIHWRTPSNTNLKHNFVFEWCDIRPGGLTVRTDIGVSRVAFTTHTFTCYFSCGSAWYSSSVSNTSCCLSCICLKRYYALGTHGIYTSVALICDTLGGCSSWACLSCVVNFASCCLSQVSNPWVIAAGTGCWSLRLALTCNTFLKSFSCAISHSVCLASCSFTYIIDPFWSNAFVWGTLDGITSRMQNWRHKKDMLRNCSRPMCHRSMLRKYRYHVCPMHSIV